ncbi:MAG: peptidylprolyl isomerase [Acidobacteria bacterium]|nr:peptidylprolyl isomerase [Acidobacteriota bacterium]
MSLVKYTEPAMHEAFNRSARMLLKAGCSRGLLLVVLVGGAFAARAEIVEEVIARVNDRIIVLSEYKRRMEELRQELSQEYSGAAFDQRFREQSQDALRDLIDQQLLLQRATELNLNVETDMVKRLDAIRQQLNLPSMEALEKAVADQGMSYEDFRQNMRDNLLTQQVIGRDVGSRIVVTPEEIQAHYEKHKQEFERPEGVRIQQILVSTEGKKEEELAGVRAKAEEALAKARSGQDFAEVARQYSDDTSTASQGGEVGFVEQSLLSPELQRAIAPLKKNEISELVETRYGFLVVKLLDRSSGGIPPLAEMQSRIHEQLYLEKIQPALREYLARMREESYILLKPGYVDTGAPPPQPAEKQKS